MKLAQVEVHSRQFISSHHFSSLIPSYRMFYSQLLLAKKGPLSKVWLAAHWEKKLNKAAILSTDIKATVGASSKLTRRWNSSPRASYGSKCHQLCARRICRCCRLRAVCVQSK